jgi:hypothetical protein
MQSIKKTNTLLYKLIFPWKIKFDTYKIKCANWGNGNWNGGIRNTEGYITISFCNFEDLSEVQNYFLDNSFMYKRQDIDLVVVKSDCSSTMVSIKSARISNFNFEKLEIELSFDAYFIIADPEEAIPYIREIKINQILD